MLRTKGSYEPNSERRGLIRFPANRPSLANSRTMNTSSTMSGRWPQVGL